LHPFSPSRARPARQAVSFCLAGVRGLELANVILVKYLGESSFGLRILWE
jgi:hypothetical protein